MTALATDIRARLDLAVAIAREAGLLTLNYFRRADLQVDRKQDNSPVTVADRQAEQLLRRRIAEAFPDDAILGEEFPDQPGRSGYRWTLDPIDGTKSFIHGVPLYGTLVGIDHEGQCLAGVIRIPALDECVYAAIGEGAWYVTGNSSPQRTHVNQTPRLAESLFLTSEVATFDKIQRRTVYEQIEAACRLTRTWGDCFGYLMVATGRAELMIDPMMNLWDAGAVLPVLQESGGTFTDWQGRVTAESGQGIATNGRILDEVLAITRG